MNFEKPIYLDSLYLKASKSFLSYFSSKINAEGEKYAKFYIKTYYNDELMTERNFTASPHVESSLRLENWTKVFYPPKGFAKINKIVLSRGLEIDNLKFYMHIDVPL